MTASAQWSAAAASVIGRQHELAEGRCEDAWAIARHNLGPERRVLALCLCDGAGSATNGWAGAHITSRYFATWLGANYADLARCPSRAASRASAILRRMLRRAARAKRTSIKSFACTLAALVVADDDRWMAFHIGDGAIVGRVDGAWIPLSIPSKGEFANVTYFVTDDDAPDSMRVRWAGDSANSGQPTAFALFTDGVEGSLINRQTGEVAPALDYVSDWLRVHSEDEVSAALARQLEEVFRGRTGDDCSLAVLSRLSVETYAGAERPCAELCPRDAAGVALQCAQVKLRHSRRMPNPPVGA